MDKKSNLIATLCITVVSLLTSTSICISVKTAMYVNSKTNDISKQVVAISEELTREDYISFEEDINLIGNSVKSEYGEAVQAEIEEEFITTLSKERLPDGDTNTYRCMDYRTITNHKSVQWALQEECFTDESVA